MTDDCSESNPIPYVATAVWNTKLWNRYPDFVSKLDDLYIQKYERITSLICGANNNAAPAALPFAPPPLGVPIPVEAIASAYPPPPPIPVPYNAVVPHHAAPKTVLSAPPPVPPPRVLWTRKDLLKDQVGKGTSIIDDNYGLAVVRFACASSPRDRFRAIVLFDTCDLWLGEHTATELNLNLGQCMKEGDYIKVKALLVPESENLKNIR